MKNNMKNNMEEDRLCRKCKHKKSCHYTGQRYDYGGWYKPIEVCAACTDCDYEPMDNLDLCEWVNEQQKKGNLTCL
jgi:hypothetical protein